MYFEVKYNFTFITFFDFQTDFFYLSTSNFFNGTFLMMNSAFAVWNDWVIRIISTVDAV